MNFISGSKGGTDFVKFFLNFIKDTGLIFPVEADFGDFLLDLFCP